MSSDAPASVQNAEPVTLDERVAATWTAVHETSAWFELPGWRWFSFAGDKAADALNGLVTNDVTKLATGRGQYAAALTAKGKIVADLVILRTAETTFLVGANGRAATGWWEVVRKYVNPRLAKYEDESSNHTTFAIYGAQASKAAARIGGNPDADGSIAEAMTMVVDQWHPWQHSTWNLGPTSVRLVRAPILGALTGFLIIASSAERDVVRKRLTRLLHDEGDLSALEIARIESGRPKYGVDMDENTLAQEATLEELDAISFDKGCYTGQETVARVHFRGHVNKRIVGLHSAEPLPSGANVLDSSGKIVGDVRSSAVSPSRGPIALAMIRRELSAGDQVQVVTASGTIEATVMTPVTTSIESQ